MKEFKIFEARGLARLSILIHVVGEFVVVVNLFECWSVSTAADHCGHILEGMHQEPLHEWFVLFKDKECNCGICQVMKSKNARGHKLWKLALFES